MSDQVKPDEQEDQVDDLEVPREEADDVKGGGASATLMKHCATGEHIKEATITVR
jgi:type VI protein secretion system component Hcp